MIPKIFVINLKKSKDRRDSIKNQMVKFPDLSYSFFDAIDGNKLTKKELEMIDPESAKKRFGKEMRLEQIGCAISHIKVYEYCLNNRIDEVLIFEDDVIFPDSFVEVLRSMLKRKSFKAEMIYLVSGKVKVWPIYKKLNHTYKMFLARPPSKTSSRFIVYAAGYYLNRAGMEKLLQKGYPIRMPADYLTGEIQHNKLVTYIIRPNLLSFSDFKTTIPER